MTIEQTVEIPASRRLHVDFDLPATASVGPARVILEFPTETEVEAPTQEEFDRICDIAKALPRPEGVYGCEEILEAAAVTAEADTAREYRLMAAKIRSHLSHPEQWSEGVRIVRAMRDEWDDPWDRSRNG